jgi:hypothetical protein
LTDSNININNNLKIRILFDTSSNLKLLLSRNSTASLLNIEYRNIVKPLGFDILAFIIDNQQLISIDLKQCVNINQSLAIYLTDNNNSILQFCNLFDNLWVISDLKEQDSKYNK